MLGASTTLLTVSARAKDTDGFWSNAGQQKVKQKRSWRDIQPGGKNNRSSLFWTSDCRRVAYYAENSVQGASIGHNDELSDMNKIFGIEVWRTVKKFGAVV